MTLILASKSPRRHELLKKLGMKFCVEESNYKEEKHLPYVPQKLACYLAFKKAEAVARHHSEDDIVIGADTLGMLNGEILGKPHTPVAAEKMLEKISGKTLDIVSGIVVIQGKKVIKKSMITRVKIKSLTPAEIKAYVATGEPLDKAAAFAIQGKGAFIVEKIKGDYDNVVGLPLKALKAILEELKQVNFYLTCDELEKLPKPNKDNWLYEIEWLKKHLPLHAKVLQVGCMDGTRILALLKARPDLKVTGLDCEAPFLTIARQKIKKSGFKNVQFILGDITKPPSGLKNKFDAVICLNNTLGYIEKDKKAIQNMKKMGHRVILSVYGEKFTDSLAKKYLKTIHLHVTRIQNHQFYTKKNVFVRRFTGEEVAQWDGIRTETPIGYISDIICP